ncbi:hypothetical protein FE236_07495 [Mariprofundus erugo]|uniref:SPOR domain-containing protein n=1 Tax=Mariprofundus erugo TaxID=2528639 RepID=UPI0010FD0A1F|nr:SPOR domain-containing protein [Mariprofundus erugo]TLS76222.1 hypothetical protein FE236_07495 [Mariprofundus erugo]
MTYKKSDDSDFALNHLDDSAHPSHTHDEPLTFDSMPPLDHRTDAATDEHDFPFGNTWEQTPPAADFSSRTEPVIKATDPDDLYDPYQSHRSKSDVKAEPVSEPIHHAADMNPPSAAAAANGNQMDTLLRYAPAALASVAMILSLIALASGGTTVTQDNSPIEEAYNSRLQQLERQVADLELQKNRQPSDYEEQISQLQEQFATLARGVAEISKRQQEQRAAPAPAPAHSQTHASTPVTSPVRSVSHSTTSGWAINIVSLDALATAKKAQQRLQAQGISTEISETTIRGKTWYRIHTPVFPNREQADAYKKMLAEKHGIKDAWTQKY